MKHYILEVVVTEGNDEWWEQLEKDSKTGADEVKQAVEDALDFSTTGLDCKVTLKKYEG